MHMILAYTALFFYGAFNGPKRGGGGLVLWSPDPWYQAKKSHPEAKH